MIKRAISIELALFIFVAMPMRMIPITIALIFFLSIGVSFGQNTIGTIQFQSDESYPGYNLIYPNHQSSVFLIDACGQIIHQWNDHPNARPGAVVRLLSDGSILKAKSDLQYQVEPTFGAGGAGGTIEIQEWDGSISWIHVIADSLLRAHHDVHMMPNGNVLAIVWEKKNLAEILQAGFDTIAHSQREIWSDAIYEIDTATHEIVWSWHAWDHLVQNIDSTKDNFGDLSEQFRRINVNYHDYTFTRRDWLHTNAIDYHEGLDQIILSVRNFNEVWIIDHSTTTEEAKSSEGGESGYGGDLLYRWGDYSVYQDVDTTTRELFWQHDAQWINPLDAGSAIAIFNNFIDDSTSTGVLLQPLMDDQGEYLRHVDGWFLPMSFSQIYQHPQANRNYSTNASSIQVLDNGHVLMCAARQGISFELNTNGQLVWEYVTPLVFGEAVSQGSIIPVSQNFTNQVRRYAFDHPAFEQRDLTPKGFIELNPNAIFCTGTNVDELNLTEINVYPNPSQNEVFISSEGRIEWMRVSQLNGQLRSEMRFTSEDQARIRLDLTEYYPGVYLVQTNLGSARIVVIN